MSIKDIKLSNFICSLLFKLSLTEFGDKAAEGFLTFFPNSLASGLFFYDNEMKSLNLIGQRGFSKNYIKLYVNDIPFLRDFVLKREIQVINNKEEKILPISRSSEALSFLFCPVLIEGELKGVVYLESLLRSYDILYLKDILNEFNKAYEHILNFEKSKFLAISDKITKLFTRRKLYYDLDYEIKRSKKFKRLFSLVFIDIDCFQRYNLTYSYDEGDLALLRVADILREECREIDLIYRYGGDEFVIIMPETLKEESLKIAEGILNKVFKIPHKNNPNIRLSVSMGIATYPEDGVTIDEILRSSDNALFYAKNKGRNNIFIS